MLAMGAPSIRPPTWEARDSPATGRVMSDIVRLREDGIWGRNPAAPHVLLDEEEDQLTEMPLWASSIISMASSAPDEEKDGPSQETGQASTKL